MQASAGETVRATLPRCLSKAMVADTAITVAQNISAGDTNALKNFTSRYSQKDLDALRSADLSKVCLSCGNVFVLKQPHCVDAAGSGDARCHTPSPPQAAAQTGKTLGAPTPPPAKPRCSDAACSGGSRDAGLGATNAERAPAAPLQPVPLSDRLPLFSLPRPVRPHVPSLAPSDTMRQLCAQEKHNKRETTALWSERSLT